MKRYERHFYVEQNIQQSISEIRKLAEAVMVEIQLCALGEMTTLSYKGSVL